MAIDKSDDLGLPLLGVDPGARGHSMANFSELLFELFGLVDAKTILEVGAYAGDLTEVLADWLAPGGGKVIAIDPKPQEALVKLAAENEAVELDERLSLDALGSLPDAEVVVIDGDHNYFTVSAELRALSPKLAGDSPPLVLLHDVCWPHGRRDAYYDSSRIPPEGLPHAVEVGYLKPDDRGVADEGLGFADHELAEREGGPRNGILTALEDFVAQVDESLRYAVVPAFFGLGVLWNTNARWASDVERTLEPLDRNPVLVRLERNRVQQMVEAACLEARLLRQANERSALLEELQMSRAFRIGDFVARLRHPRRGRSWKERLDGLIEDG